jgi:hypothetical protein
MTTKADLELQIAQLTEANKKADMYHPQQHKDETRSEIALFVVHSFFYLIGIVLIGVPIYNQFAYPDIRLSVVDIVTVLAGVISGPFGFVVGYYFKGSEND